MSIRKGAVAASLRERAAGAAALAASRRASIGVIEAIGEDARGLRVDRRGSTHA
jgi:hypothetical protein